MGNKQNSFRVKLGRLEIYMSRKVMHWRSGLCTFTQPDSTWQRKVIILGGTLTAMLVSTGCFVLACWCNWHGFIKAVTFIFAAMGWQQLFTNLLPNGRAIRTQNGVTYSDGQQLFGKHVFEQAMDLYNKKRYREAAAMVKPWVKAIVLEENTLRFLMGILVAGREMSDVKVLFERLRMQHTLTSNDYTHVASAFLHTNEYGIALQYLDAARALDKENWIALTNYGWTYNAQGQYHEALPLLEAALQLQANEPYTLCYRGWARVKTGALESGIADIREAYKALPEMADTAYCLGIYYLETGDKMQALKWFTTARERDANQPDIDKLLAQASA